MKPTLEQLYLGELRPNCLPVPTSEEYQENADVFSIACEHFVQALQAVAPDLEARFKNIIDSYTVMCVIEKEDLFQYAFSLGVRLVTEAVSIQ